MHIPDGFLATKIWLPAWAISASGLSICLKKLKTALGDRIVPLMGVTSAFVFAAQMVDFPVFGGTSGHVLGCALSAILLGPYAGALVLSVVLFAQCFLFQDGGVIALGANMLNMVFIGTWGGYLIYSFLLSRLRSVMISSAVAAWFSVVLAAGACAAELAISGTSPFKMTAIAMIGTHAFVGIMEAIVTVFIIGLVLKIRPDLIHYASRVHR